MGGDLEGRSPLLHIASFPRDFLLVYVNSCIAWAVVLW